VSKFECSIIGGMLGGWMQLMLGYTQHAYYTLGIMAVVMLMAILNYLRLIYLSPK